MLDERSSGEDVSVLEVPEDWEVQWTRCPEEERRTYGSTP